MPKKLVPEKPELEVLEDPLLNNLEKIKYGFFTRQGGVSTGIYASLNCAYACEDDKKNVQENRRRCSEHLGYPLEKLMTVKNIHSNKAVILEKLWDEQDKPEADGIVSNKPGILLGSDSADCPIVLLADNDAGVIGLAHAGWQSAKHGIVEETARQMVSIGARYNHMVAVIGPCIAQNSYEIDEEFYKQFLNESLENQQFFIPSHKVDHYLFDLRAYVKHRLINLGLQSVSTIEVDTFSDEDRFFSCRRARLKCESDFGGHFSCIGLK